MTNRSAPTIVHIGCLSVLLGGCFITPSARAQGFAYGVAAGDVTHESIVLWTRADTPGPVRVELSPEETFANILLSAEVEARPESDNTLSLDISGLSPATRYHYRFHALSSAGDSATILATSRVGRFLTAPAPDAPAPLRFMMSGDSNANYLPFQTLGAAAKEDADLFIWFGDLIYGDVAAGEVGAAVTLEGYRAKYRQIRSDPNVQELLARMAVYVGWDDHEVRNDYAGTDPLLRSQRDAAYQAFFEYLPIRRTGGSEDPFRTYRRFRHGRNVEFFLLDGRQYRDLSAIDACGGNPDPLGFFFPTWLDVDCRALLSAPRTMLGAAQRQWLMDGLAGSEAGVKFLINNVPMMHVGLYPYDRWDGYDSERRELLQFIDAQRVSGVVVMTTDIHANAHNPDLTRYFKRYRPDYGLSGAVAIPELIAGPIGTETLYDELLEQGAAALGLPFTSFVEFGLTVMERLIVARLERLNGLAFVEENQMAYVLVDVTEDGRVNATWRGVPKPKPFGVNAPKDEPVETMYTAPVLPPRALPAPPCAWPVLMLAGFAWMARKGKNG